MPITLKDHEKSLVEGCLKGLQGESYPKEITEGSLDIESAYRVQLGLLERQVADGRVQGGWKCGNPPPALLEALGEGSLPCGPLFRDGFLESGAQLPANTPRLLLEVEVEVILGSALEGPNATSEQARAAASSVAPCFELIGGNIPEVNMDKFRGFLAAGMGNLGVVSGPAVSPLPSDLDFAALTSELWIDGKRGVAASNDAGAGSPFERVADLANFLSKFGIRLEAGQRIITGARVVQIQCDAGTYEGRVSGLGSVQLTLT